MYTYTMEINFKEFISSKKIFHMLDCEEGVSNREALKLLCDKQDDYDIIAFGCLKKLLIMNIGVLQSDHCGRYFSVRK